MKECCVRLYRTKCTWACGDSAVDGQTPVCSLEGRDRDTIQRQLLVKTKERERGHFFPIPEGGFFAEGHHPTREPSLHYTAHCTAYTLNRIGQTCVLAQKGLLLLGQMAVALIGVVDRSIGRGGWCGRRRCAVQGRGTRGERGRHRYDSREAQKGQRSDVDVE